MIYSSKPTRRPIQPTLTKSTNNMLCTPPPIPYTPSLYIPCTPSLYIPLLHPLPHPTRPPPFPFPPCPTHLRHMRRPHTRRIRRYQRMPLRHERNRYNPPHNQPFPSHKPPFKNPSLPKPKTRRGKGKVHTPHQIAARKRHDQAVAPHSVDPHRQS